MKPVYLHCKTLLFYLFYELIGKIFSAPPDQGLTVKPINEKKKNKFCLTLGFACNSDASQKMLVFFIEKYKKPCVFRSNTPAFYGCNYYSNKKAWMTAELFEE